MRNFTPFPCLPHDVLLPSGERITSLVIKATLDLRPAEPGSGLAGTTHLLHLSQEQRPIALVAAPFSEDPASSLRWESDISPPKPSCDVLVVGNAHAPGGRPRRRFEAGLKLRTRSVERALPPRPFALGPGMDIPEEELRSWEYRVAQAKASPETGRLLLDKRLEVTGERWLKRRNPLIRVLGFLVGVLSLGVLRRTPWFLTRPKPLLALPLRYEFSFGGHRQVHASDAGSRRVPKRQCLPGVVKANLRQAWDASRTDGLLAEAWWEENPAGRGYVPAWLVKASRIKRLPAPQIQDPEHPFTARAAWRAMCGKVSGRIREALRPQGFGVISRHWACRLKLAGTWGEDWARSGAPYPLDYSRSFDNCAHPDMRCRHLEGDEEIELINLCAASTPGIISDAEGNQVMRFQLPGFYPFVALGREKGDFEEIPGILDTLVIEPDEARVTLIYKVSFPVDPLPETLEIRLSMPGEPRGLASPL